MLNNLPFALITAHRAMQTHVNSARPDAPVVPEAIRTHARPRTYRTRAALAARLARVADYVAPGGGVPAHRTASSR
jgi:hypothetical protein